MQGNPIMKNIGLIGDKALQIMARQPSCRVHSSFRTAINLLFNQEGGRDKHISIIKDDYHPYALTCRQLPDLTSALQAGDAGLFSGTALVFADKNIAFQLCGAEMRAQPDIAKPISPPETIYPALAAWEEFLTAYARDHDAVACHQAYLAPIRQAAGLLPERKSDCFGLDMLSSLVGLGPGLTPLGDDFLSGYLAALYLLLDSPQQKNLVAGWARVYSEQNTTFFSRSQLAYAGQGLCLGAVHALIALLAQGIMIPEADLLKVAGIGATSGYGWLWGISIAFRVLLA